MGCKRILTIQDISCVGQCSMTVALPVLSAWGHETCVLPTALLSTHTGGFGKPAVVHYDEALEEICAHWENCGITFDAILVGYLGSIPAVEIAERIRQRLLAPEGIFIVDPAMADHGKRYSGLSEAYAEAMASLCRRADILLPNLTEAAMLSGHPYQEAPDADAVRRMMGMLPNPTVLLTGVGFGAGETGIALKEGETLRHYAQEKIGAGFHGTGDLFAACFTGALLHGRTCWDAAKIAADLTRSCIETTVSDPAHWYGIRFESILPKITEYLV